MILDQLSIHQIEDLDDGEVDPKELSSLVDRLQVKFCRVVDCARKRGDHLVFSPNISPVGWVSGMCSMSRNSASDRLCVGSQIESLPKVAEALRAGEIGYQPVAVICHLNEQLAEKGDRVVEEDWVEYARKFSVKELRDLAAVTRHVVDPDGFVKDANEDFEGRGLHISQSGSMFVINGVLDREGGAALKTAIDSLSKRHAPDDERAPRQRRTP